jgi:prophage DNA circulation protein
LEQNVIAPWRAALLPASFRGVGFFVQSAKTEVGRRNALHEYPQRDDAYSEDLGLRADRFGVEAIVIGPDYFRDRDALIAALKTRGPGKLIHPYYGQRNVALAGPVRISESPEEGGLARFSLDFVECADAPQEPSAREDTRGAVESAANAAIDPVAEDFAESFSTEGFDAVAEESIIDMARTAIGKINDLRKMLPFDPALIADVAFVVQQVSSNLASLIRQPAAFAQSILGLFGSFTHAASSLHTALLSYKGLRSHNPEIANALSTKAKEAAAALPALVRRAALIESARAASNIDFDTYDEAIAVRDELAAQLADEAAGIVRYQEPGIGNEQTQGTLPPISDTRSPISTSVSIPVSEPVYQALIALRVALIRDISIRAIAAPRRATTSLPATMPALVVAWRIHADATRDAEIVTRNRLRHPGFVPGGIPIEYLSP